jgi:murein DD-endopeptidase MepM/ murein hydrolase activator NlpD
LSKKLVDLNQIVTAGDNIGLVGSTGRVTGPHLHWEVYYLGIPINPEIFIKN